MSHEQIIATRTVYEGRLLTLVTHDVALPNGATAQREVVLHPGAVALVAFDDDGLVLLVQQFRLAAHQVLWELPAGTRTLDEPLALCAQRELREETGYRAERLTALGQVYVAPSYTTEAIALFLAEGLTLDPLPGDADEFITVGRVPLVEALHMLERGDIQDAKTAVGLLRVARLRGV